MRIRVTLAIGLTAVTVLALPACSADTDEANPAPSARSKKPATTGQTAAPLSSATLETRLLDERSLGMGYTRAPERPAQHDDVTVLGCPTLEALDGDAATGGSLDFPR
ncbi:hypothetical protein [Streptomyces collinus]|uniref:hypothetical protein n=1 Tax=Streptomyces collinus TaxID=42684 RepID=UPI0037D92D39